MNLLFQKGENTGVRSAFRAPVFFYEKSPRRESPKESLFRRAGAARAVLLENLPQRAVSVEMTKERRDSAPLFSLPDSF